MAFGFQRQQRVFVGDTATLNAYCYEDDETTLVSLVDINQVLFTVVKPSDTVTPSVDQVAGTVTDDGEARFIVSDTVINEPGEYRATAQFVLNDGRKKTSIIDFDVVDPYEAVGVEIYDETVDYVWRKLSDLFDSELGGPWLRDKTMARFDKSRLRSLLPEVVTEFNLQQPVTDFTIDTYPYADTDAEQVLAQGLLCSTIMHMIRSYTEQPDIVNPQIGYMDRKRYADAWKSVYDVEFQKHSRMLALYKRTLFGFGRGKGLISVKAGRLMPAPIRSRNIGRGYY